MLLQMTVENYRSFRDRTTFSLLVPEGSNAAPHTWVEVAGYRVLRAAAIYGANASGKSNFFHALSTAAQLVTTRTQVNERLPLVPFRLNAEKQSEPTRFEFELLLDGIRYSYGFVADRVSVIEEWLFRDTGTGEEELVFERDLSSQPFRFGPLLKESGERAVFVAEGSRVNQLFLAEAVDRNLVQVKAVYDWFDGSIFLVGPESRYHDLAIRVREDAAFRSHLVESLAQIDTGITGLTTVTHTFGDVSSRVAGDQFPKSGVFNYPMPLAFSDDSTLIGDGADLKVIELKTARRDDRGHAVEFSTTSESDGTVRYMHLVPALLPGESTDELLVVDELDRSLHTLLTRRFVEDFLAQPAENLRQLIYTTHDTNLLTRDLLPPEAVWFTEKDAGGATSLYSLAEFDQSQLDALGTSLEAGYLAGRFGAIPFMADRARLGWLKPEGGE